MYLLGGWYWESADPQGSALSFCATKGLTSGNFCPLRGTNFPFVGADRGLVLDEVEALPAESNEVVDHSLQYLGVMTYPRDEFFDDAHRVASSI